MRAEFHRAQWEIQSHRQAFRQSLDEVDGDDYHDSDFAFASDKLYESLEVTLIRELIDSERLHGD